MGCDECSEAACLWTGHESVVLAAPTPERTTLSGSSSGRRAAQSLRMARLLSAPNCGAATVHMADQEPMLSFDCHFETW